MSRTPKQTVILELTVLLEDRIDKEKNKRKKTKYFAVECKRKRWDAHWKREEVGCGGFVNQSFLYGFQTPSHKQTEKKSHQNYHGCN